MKPALASCVCSAVFFAFSVTGSGAADASPAHAGRKRAGLPAAQGERALEQIVTIADRRPGRIYALNDEVRLPGEVVSYLVQPERYGDLSYLIQNAEPTARDLPPPDRPQTYRVKAGDTYYSIAAHFGMSIDRLMQINNARGNALLQIGQVLRLRPAFDEPAPKAPAKPAPVLAAPSPRDLPPEDRPQSYTVQAGDTYYAIAARFGMSIDVLMRLNNALGNPLLRIGQVLKLRQPDSELTKKTLAGGPGNARPAAPKPEPAKPSVKMVTKVSKSSSKKRRKGQVDRLRERQKKHRFNPTGREISLVVPLKERQFYLGDITLTISQEDKLSVQAARLAKLLSDMINQDAVSRILALSDAGGHISTEALATTGFALVYDPGLLELSITIPQDARLRRGFNVTDLDRQQRGNFAKPARFSAFVTARTSFDFIETGPSKGLVDPFVDLTAGGRVGQVAFENEAFYDNAKTRFGRRGTRLIYDDVKAAIRYQAGDIRPVTRGFQNSVDTFGVSLERAFSTLQPLRVIRPRGERSFVLTEPASVEIFVNDRPVRRLRLQPGTFDLSDFPFVSGSNNVRIKVEGDDGLREEITFNLFFDRTMLARGTSEFALAGGVAEPIRNGVPDYNFSRPLITGFYRRGMSERLTLGANVQADDKTGIFASEATWSSPIGAFRPQAALSVASVASDIALSLDFERSIQGKQENARRNLRRFDLSVNYTGKHFAQFGTVTTANQFSFDGAANYSWNLTPKISTGISLDYSQGRGTQANRYGGGARFGFNVTPGIGATVDVRYDKTGSRDGVSVFFTLTRRLGSGQSGRTSYDTRGQRAMFSYTRTGDRTVGSTGLSADVEATTHDAAFNADLDYQSSRADLSISHRASFDVGGGVIADQRTSLRIASSLAFADGSLTVGRPITSSFAILKAHKSLRGHAITIDPESGKYYSRSGMLGPPLARDLGAYTKGSIRYDVENLPIGYNLGEGSFEVLPPLHAGYKLVVGSDYAISVLGTLQDADKKPVSYLTGTARLIAGPNGARPASGEKEITVFTNGSGRFGAAFKLGTWRITMNTRPKTAFEFTVPASAQGLYRAGTLSPVSVGGKK